MKNSYLFLLGLGLLTIWSCDDPEPIPAYIVIPDFEIFVNESRFGTASSDIKEVWVTINGGFLGVYDLPATVPVLEMGDVEIKLEAGIHDNGISSIPDIYPFYSPWETTVTLSPNATVTLTPSSTYLPETKMAFIEDFESGAGRVFTQNLFGEQELERSGEDVFEGSFSGRIVLDSATNIVEILSGTAFGNLIGPDIGFFSYLEINYKSDVPVVWGIAGDTGIFGMPERFFGPGFFGSDDWQKIYINIIEILVGSPYDEHQILLQAFKPGGEEVPSPAVVYLDNIKLVHF